MAKVGRILGYDVPAEGYRELYGEEQLEKYDLIFRTPMIDLGGVELVLDVGCGIGLLREYLRELGFDGLYVGLDILEDRIVEARKNRDHGSDLVLADAHHLPFRDRVFDLTALITVAHLLRIESSLKELERVSRRILIVTILKGLKSSAKLSKIVRELMSNWMIIPLDEPWIKDLVYILVRRGGLRGQPKPISWEEDHLPDVTSPSQDH